MSDVSLANLASLLVAGADLAVVKSLRKATSGNQPVVALGPAPSFGPGAPLGTSASAFTSANRVDVRPADEYLPRQTVHPTPHILARPTLHPAPRIEPQETIRPEPIRPATDSSPIGAPWAALPTVAESRIERGESAVLSRRPGQVKTFYRAADDCTQGRLLDVFC